MRTSFALKITFLCVLAASIPVLPAIAQSAYTVQSLGLAFGGLSLSGLNNNGEAICNYNTSRGDTNTLFYSNGNVRNITMAGGTQLVGSYGINDNGQIAAGAAVGPAGSPPYQAVLYNGHTDTVQNVFPTPGYGSFAFAVNNQGVVAGAYQLNDDTAHAFTSQNGQIKDLGTLGGTNSSAYAINSRGDVAGYSQLPGSFNQYAMLYSNGVMQNIGILPGGNTARALGINDSDQVVGYSNGVLNGQGYFRGFLYQNGTMRDLGTFGGLSSNANAINNAGTIVGLADEAGGGSSAYVYSNGTMHRLSDLITDKQNWGLGNPTAINEKGQIAGIGYHQGEGLVVYLATPVTSTPAPGSLWLTGGAGLLMAWRLRRRGKK